MAFWVCDFGHRNDDVTNHPLPVYWRKCAHCSPQIEYVYKVERDVAETDPARIVR